ncbi:MAG: ATP-binding protein [Gordonia sp. (in: high G+C Gram-positive bacteria)]|uniref:sensor histidine kinase n=1 Tax=Gordonia sp. (in: high G+C Gram-positive bacteria) TaxID=84139 RepID=UPI003C70764D
MARRAPWKPVLQQIQSTGTAILGIAYLGVFVLAPTDLARYTSVAARWWAWSAAAVVAVSAAAMVWAGVARRIESLSVVASVCALGYLAVVAAWWLAWDGTRPADPGPPLDLWVVYLPQVGSCVLVMNGSLRGGLANVAVAGGASLAISATLSGTSDWDDLATGVWLLALLTVYQVIAWAVTVGARRFDEDRDLAMRQAVARLPSRFRTAERRRLDAIVHDRLIALLLALRPGPLSEGMAAAIGQVRAELAELPTAALRGPERIGVEDLVERLRLAVDDSGRTVPIETVIRADPGTDFPAAATDALIDALAEAVRNVHRHAGAGAGAGAVCTIDADAITVTVVDDGVGFDPAAVPANRIGVALGIVERMRQLDGGSGRVLSAPGGGTRVDLSWSAQRGVR